MRPDQRFVRFPPRWANVLVPVAPRAATAVGISLYTAVKPAPVLVQRTLWAAALVAGGRALPGPREAWTPPVDDTVWRQLGEQWSAMLGRRPDGIAVYERLQSERAGLTVLLCAGDASALVRVRRDPASLHRERVMSAAAQRLAPAGFRVPVLAGSGTEQGWHWVAYRAISARPHRPRLRLPAAVFAEITALVEQVVDRPAGTPQHWRGAHGDVVPWNLRRAGGHTWLIDWEDAGWAPPGTDAVYLAAAAAAMRPGPVRPLRVPPGHDEARARLADQVRDRPTSDVEQKLRDRLLTLLGG